MCHSPKVNDEVDIEEEKILEPLFSDIFFEELLTAATPQPLELLT